MGICCTKQIHWNHLGTAYQCDSKTQELKLIGRREYKRGNRQGVRER